MAIKKQEWTVRIIVHHDYGPIAGESVGRIMQATEEARRARDSAWLGEYLRYAGLTRRLAEFQEGEKRREVFELYCPNPKQHDTKQWAEMNSARLRSFGLDAAAAPKWDSYEPVVDKGPNRHTEGR